ncbi:Protein LGC-33 [Aphelenchoides avenae]|nr:Protein LGC-33 [Aphelenchus avenae]
MVFFRAQSLVQSVQAVLFYFALFETILLTTTLSPEERSELARKFKYYHRSVRPGDRYNLVETINGTFFSLHAEVELLRSRQSDDRLHLEIVMTLHYNDDRLVLRELSSVLSIPAEFQPWLPDIEIRPSSEVKQSYHLDPKTGQVTIIFRLAPTLSCDSERWRYPFEKYSCELNIVASEDERIFLRLTRDLRPDAQIMLVKYTTDQWPHLVFRFTYSAQWQSAIVDVYVPSILIFSVVAFAQWKRRKTQVTVTVASLISMLLLATHV